MSDPINSIKLTLTDAQKTILKGLQDKAKTETLNIKDVKDAFKASGDAFVGNDGVVNTEDEVQFFRAILNGQIDGADQFTELSTFLKSNTGNISELFPSPDGKIDGEASNQVIDYNALVREDKKDELNADGVKSVDIARNKWRNENVGNTFSVSNADGLNEAVTASSIHGSFSMDNPTEGKTKIRSMLKTFWNNDGKNIKFLSIKEMNAIRAWGEKNYEDKEQFHKDFKEMFLLSVKEDTPFSMSLMAKQWTEIMGSSTFMGQGAKGPTGFKTFFNELGSGIATDIVKAKGIKLDPGKEFVIASFNGKKDHPGFDNVVMKVVGPDFAFKVDISKSSHGDAKKIGYDFDGSISGSATPAKPAPAGGMGGTPVAGNSTSVNKKALNENIDKAKSDLKQAADDEPVIAPNLDGFKDVGNMTPDELKGLLYEIQSIRASAFLSEGIKPLVDSIISELTNLIKEQATPAVPPAPPAVPPAPPAVPPVPPAVPPVPPAVPPVPPAVPPAPPAVPPAPPAVPPAPPAVPPAPPMPEPRNAQPPSVPPAPPMPEPRDPQPPAGGPPVPPPPPNAQPIPGPSVPPPPPVPYEGDLSTELPTDIKPQRFDKEA